MDEIDKEAWAKIEQIIMETNDLKPLNKISYYSFIIGALKVMIHTISRKEKWLKEKNIKEN